MSCDCQNQTQREVFFDVVKAFAIGLVVLSHTLSINGVATCNFIGNFIVGMNMPLFFILSGYFAHSTLENADITRFKRHIRSYLWPTAFVSCLFAVLSVPFGLITISKAPLYAVKYFLFPLWYVWALCIMYALTFVSCACFSKLRHRLMIMGVVYLTLFFLPSRTWYISNVRAMFPYFVAGAFLFRTTPLWKSWKVGCLSAVVYLVLCCFEGNIHTNGLSFYAMSTHWRSLSAGGRPIYLFAARILIGFVGSIGVLYVLKQFTDGFPWASSRISTLGTTTLGVYLLHQWILHRTATLGPWSATGGVALAVLVWLLCHILTVYSKRNMLVNIVVWGNKTKEKK